MKRSFTSLFTAVLVCIAAISVAQPACGYNIDVDGDLVADGLLYRDMVFTDIDDIVIYNDLFGGPGSITYSRDAELYDGTLTDLKMDVYVPPSVDTVASQDRPVIFFFYGGGFTEGNSIRVKDLALQYVQRGFVTVAPNYRLGIYGTDPSDTIHVCEDLLQPAYSAFRALLDAQAAMRWMRDSADIVLGVDVDPNNFFVHGPSFFPMLSHMQSDEMPTEFDFLGTLDDSLPIKASVGRSAALNLVDLFIDNDDTAPFFIFHGTCDKSVPFSRYSTYRRFGCDTVIDPSLTDDYPLFGSYEISQAVNHYFEWHPVCGLHHSLKDMEEDEMVEPVAQFFYDMVCDVIPVTADPKIVPWIRSSCDVSNKCVRTDYYSFCDTAMVMAPDDGACLAREEGPTDYLPARYPDHPHGMTLFPSPNKGSFSLTYVAEAEKVSMFEVFDMTGRLRYAQQISLVNGINVAPFNLPDDLENGIYLIAVDGEAGPRLVLE
jgi:hypothetical protein